MRYSYPLIGEGYMFHGKNMPLFLRRYEGLYREMVEIHGIEKVRKTYYYFFNLCQKMQWGQWFVLNKMCSKPHDRLLLFWVMEMIYQSDLLSDFRFEHHPTDDKAVDEVRIVVVAPSEERLKRQSVFFVGRHYVLNDWYGRLLYDPKSNPDVRPEWLMLEQARDEEDTDIDESESNQ